MTFSIKRFQAIVHKEWKDTIKNPQILLMVAMPILFAYLFKEIGGSRVDLISFPILLALTMTGSFVQAMMIAEEKEKFTLRVLMLSPAKTSEILLGKSTMTAFLTLFTVVLSIWIADIELVNIPLLSLLIVLSLVMFSALGTTIGLLSRTVQESSVVGLPMLIIFLMGPMFAPMLENETLTSIVRLLPSEHFQQAMFALADGATIKDVSGHIWNQVIWMFGSIALAVIIYSRKRFDK